MSKTRDTSTINLPGERRPFVTLVLGCYSSQILHEGNENYLSDMAGSSLEVSSFSVALLTWILFCVGSFSVYFGPHLDVRGLFLCLASWCLRFPSPVKKDETEKHANQWSSIFSRWYYLHLASRHLNNFLLWKKIKICMYVLLQYINSRFHFGEWLNCWKCRKNLPAHLLPIMKTPTALHRCK